MKRFVITTALAAALCATPVSAEPEFRLTYPNGVPRAEITGDWRHSRYSVWRAAAVSGPFERLGEGDVLCVGPCFVDDYSAAGGRTYFYRFDLLLADGSFATFGPYAAAILSNRMRALSAAVFPNPGHGSTEVTLFASGRPGTTVGGEAALFDMSGRRVRTLFHGPLSSGPTRLRWDGRDEHGQELRAGLYLLRLATWDGRVAVTRVARTR